MRIKAILNRDGGTLKTTDLDAFSEHLVHAFDQAGHRVSVERISGRELMRALDRAGQDDHVDAILAGGGDGTISAAAQVAWKSGKVLGVLPAGTMNLFARSLEVPLALDEAAMALAWGQTIDCDIATANGRSFIHQFSVGLQPSVIRERDRNKHGSRFAKMLNGLSAAFTTLREPPIIRAEIACDGTTLDDFSQYSLLAVSNNPYGEGVLPYADRLNRGLLGLYRAESLSADAYFRLAGDLLVGSLNDSADLHFSVARKVELLFPHAAKSDRASIDGELIALDPEIEILIHPGELKVLAPTGEAGD